MLNKFKSDDGQFYHDPVGLLITIILVLVLLFVVLKLLGAL